MSTFTDIYFVHPADALVSTGLADLGYVYVNIGTILAFEMNILRVVCACWTYLILLTADDCWSSATRNSKVS